MTDPTMTPDELLLSAADVRKLLNVSDSYLYKANRQLIDEGVFVQRIRCAPTPQYCWTIEEAQIIHDRILAISPRLAARHERNKVQGAVSDQPVSQDVQDQDSPVLAALVAAVREAFYRAVEQQRAADRGGQP